VKVPNFDDVDLGIIAIATILVVALIVIAFKVSDATGLKESLAFLGVGITAIATLAGRKVKQDSGEMIKALLAQANEIDLLKTGLDKPPELPEPEPDNDPAEEEVKPDAPKI